MQQAGLYSLPFDTSWQQPFSLSYFVDALACLPGAIAGFVDEVAAFAGAVSRPADEDYGRTEKHDVFTDNSLRL
jgi:hypothetical protein